MIDVRINSEKEGEEDRVCTRSCGNGRDIRSDGVESRLPKMQAKAQ